MKYGWAWGCVRVIVASVLLVAAYLKTENLPHQAIDGIGNFAFNTAVILLEASLALWLLAGVVSAASWVATVVVLSLFTIVSLFKGLTGEASCGCFGAVEVNLWWTVSLDLGLLGLLLLCRRQAMDGQSIFSIHLARTGFCTWAVSILAASIPVGGAMLVYPFPHFSADGVLEDGDGTVWLQPERWLGSEFPLAMAIDVGDRFSDGQWRIALVRHDCRKCAELIEHLQQSDTHQVAVVQVPPYGEVALAGANVVRGHLVGTKEWFVRTPVEILLEDGIVVAVNTPS